MKHCTLIVLLALALVPFAAPAATYTVSNTNATGAGSLHQAILDANANAGPDTIAFNITNASLTIRPASALPSLTDPVTIDGSTQPGFANRPIVEVSGSGAGANADGFRIVTGNCVIRALAINRFRGDGIQITNGSGSRVEGCYIGVAPDGFTRRGNGQAGVRIAGVNFGQQTSSANTIGGGAAAAHNLISGNYYGIWLSETTDNLILGNIIGADATGSFDVGNTNMGIFCYYLANQNLIGGTNAGARNLISGNGEEPYLYAGDGIRMDSSSSNSVFGNYIGVDVTGAYAIPNGQHGVDVQYGNNNLIGGPAAGQGNFISGNQGHGVNLGGFGEGTSAFSPAGTPPPLPEGNVVQGNLIGTDVTGQLPIPNERDGVFIGNMRGNLVGGFAAGEGNVISGNFDYGVEIVSYNTESNQVAGNFIGITRVGALPLGNARNGVYIEADNNIIGGTNTGAGNIIAHNGGSGVATGYRMGMAILGNSIYANTNLGLDLGDNGLTFNDPGDEDSGPNNFQNFPVLTRAITNGTQTLISGSLNSASNTTYRVELFDNPIPDPSGYGEGQTYLGFLNVTTDGAGDVGFMFTNSGALPLGHFITATATDPDGNTSEFSAARKVVSANSVDLEVALTDSADPVPRFTNFTYTVTVTNFGPTNATGVFVTNRLSPGLAFVSAAPTQGSAVHNAGVVVWNAGALADGAGASLGLTVFGSVTALESNSVVAISAWLENDSANNAAVETTFVGIADLGLALSDAPDPVVAGQPLTYTLTVNNLGPDAASDAVVGLSLDGNVFIISAGLSQGTYSQVGNNLELRFGTINAHATATGFVTVLPREVGITGCSASSSRREMDTNAANDGAYETTTVQAGPGVLQFTSTGYTVSEGAGSGVVFVQRTGGALGTVAVSVTTADLTATAGSDYIATSRVLVFADGETFKSFNVAITDDFLSECNETLTLRLFSPTGGAILLPPTNTVLQIFDNDITPVGSVKVVSRAQANLVTSANSSSQGASVSDDGRYVAFQSYANNLTFAPDNNNASDIYIHDRLTRSNRLASAGADGVASSGSAFLAQISADGSRVGFVGFGPELTTNAASGQQIYVRTLASGVNQLVSVNTNGAGGNNSSYYFSLSTNGTKVAYESTATDLVAGVPDLNATSDVFFRDLSTGTNILVSVNAAGTGSANGSSDSPVLSADGRYVVFGSYATDLTPADTTFRFDIFRRDLVTGITELVSATPAGVAGNNHCDRPFFISADGRYVAFSSYSSNLVPGTPSFTQQTFRRDMVSGTTIIVSRSNSGVAANGFTIARGMSRDGRYILFDTSSSNLATNDNNFSNDVFVRDEQAGITHLVSINRDASGPGDGYSPASAISPDGRYVTFSSTSTNLVGASVPEFSRQLYARDLLNGTTALISTRLGETNGANGSVDDSVVSTNGVVVFSSYSEDLVPVDANGSSDVFSRAPGDTNVTLLSFALGITGSSYSSQHALNGAGTKVAFASTAANLVTNDHNSNPDIFLRDLAANATKLVSVNAAGTAGAMGYSENPSLSEDGRYVTYQSGAQDIVANDGNGFIDVYLRDTVAETSALISINQSGTGAGNHESINARITPDGRFIVFESRASNLAPNDMNGDFSDIFLRNRTNNVTELISLNAAGTASANGESYNARISPDGRYVVYQTFSSNLGPVDSNEHFDIYVRDRLTSSNILCSRNLAGNNGGNGDSYGASLSADGNTVVFTSDASDLATGDTNGVADVFAFNLTTRALKLVSATPAGLVGKGASYDPSVSANGRYVAFQSEATNLVATADGNGSPDVFVRDLVANTTTLVSLNCHGTSTGNEASYESQISADGRYVVFSGAASDIVPGVFQPYLQNVFRRDLQTGTTVLLSQNRFSTGGGNGASYYMLVNAAGGVVSFLSDASDLVADDANHLTDVFVWNDGVVVAGVDLALNKTASTSVAGECLNLTYMLAVTNHGTAPATGVRLTDTLPAGMTFFSASTTQGSVTNSGGTITAQVGSLNVGAGARVSVIVTATSTGSIVNTAVATANEADVTPANNMSSIAVTVTPLVSPAISLIASNAAFHLTWPSSTPNVFVLQCATNLTPSITWRTLTNVINDNGSVKSLLITNDLFAPERYYRLKKQ